MLSRLPNPCEALASRLAVVGVGQTLRGDDGAGPAVISRLKHLMPPDDRLLLLNAAHAPENALGPIIRFRPDMILMVDAVQGGRSAGAISCFEATESESYGGGSTHTLPLPLLSEYLTSETGAPVYIIGIQPAAVEFGEGFHPAVQWAVSYVADSIAGYWRKAAAACSAINAGDVSVVNT